MKLEALLEAIANLAAIHDRGIDHVDPANAHREGVTAVLTAAADHAKDIEARVAALEQDGMPPEAQDRIAALEAQVAELTSLVNGPKGVVQPTAGEPAPGNPAGGDEPRPGGPDAKGG